MAAKKATRSRSAKARGARTGGKAPRRTKARAAAEADGGAKQPADQSLLTMDQAIGLLKTSRPTFYRWLRSGRVKGMKIGRQWRFRREDIDRFLRGERPSVEVPASVSLQPLIETLERKLKDQGGDPDAARSGPIGDQPIGRAVALMIALGLAADASDMHLAPHEVRGDRGGTATLRFRIAGVMHTMAQFDLRLLPALIARWKPLAGLEPTESRRPLDGRCMAKIDGRDVDMRVCFVPAHGGEAVTVRLLQRDAVMPSLDRMPFAPRDAEKLQDAIHARNGLILCCGPTGCGKTTTLYACLQDINHAEKKIMTVEDPVEYSFAGMVQMPLNPDAGMTFPGAIRSMLRSGADVIFVGEIREPEVMQLCLQASLTGHLVFSTLHTNDAPLTIQRMLDIGAPPFLIADATRLIAAQRLVRTLCPECSEPTELDVAQLEFARQHARQGGLDWEAQPMGFRAARGCARCAETGYRGRTVVAEMLEVTGEIRAAICRGASTGELRTIAVGQGMTTMVAGRLRRAAEGETSIDEVMRVAPK